MTHGFGTEVIEKSGAGWVCIRTCGCGQVFKGIWSARKSGAVKSARAKLNKHRDQAEGKVT